ncbi:PREDICTED: thioredoxin domain-containing protein 16 isoform X2 [Pseudopodoces humilis]|uniref:thioredoxin domain-containing protein 16 isoform X2 n=1 Tax=Pseudopodoces humilis TaxID=181119 RepID=UPI0006B7EC42|nr:PREDICTED: thioredoxin domain-containing protein 16 isoform X2 [Pseudopodoces humilis]
MSAQKDGWVSSLVFLLFCASSIPKCGSASLQQEPSPQHYFSGLEAGKTSLAFFTPSVSPGAQPFLEQIESSAEVLQDYGISVVKVNCPKEDVSRYCGKENALRKAFLFRGNRLIREFPTDALFDVNSIVANVLFALLFNEVKYIEALADLENIENVLKGKSNMVFAYVPATGTAEHRAVMEAAFVYGTIHQFVLTTEAALLKATSHDDPDVSSAWLLFCHCQQVTEPAQPCRRTALAQPLTLLSIHRHLKLMGAPLVTEVAEDPEKISTVHLQLGLPLVFILSQKETYEADRRTAEFVAWQLLGKAGVALLSRDLVDLNVLHRSNIALKTPEEGMPIQYLVLEDTDEVITLVEDKNKVKQIQEDEQEEEEDEDEKENNQDIQDDQVVEAVSRDKKRELPLEQILVLTEENFHSSLSEAARTVVLFYASWEAVSLAVLRSYSEVAAHLKGTLGVLLSRVNCWDWPGLCSQENVTQFPTIKIYKEGQQSVTYDGMWGTEELSSFILLSRVPCPLKLTTMDEAEGYLRGEIPSELSSHHHTSLLGVFSTDTSKAREAFEEAGNILSGHVRMGMYFEDDALALKKTPVGHGILRTYFSTTPSLPVLLWVNLHAGGQVFKFPSEQSITEMNILSWLEKLQAGLEIPSSTLSEEDWKPPLPAYDFLQMMEPSVPELSPQPGNTPDPPKIPGGDTARGGGDTASREEPSQESTAEEFSSPGRDLRGTAPRLAARDKQGKRHSEL